MAISEKCFCILMTFMAFFDLVWSARITKMQEILNPWRDAHATFYGDMAAADTMQGACGYGDLFQQGYGLETAALSSALFNDGQTCGACFEIKCVDDPQWCLQPARPIRITATNLCPPNYTQQFGSWCNPPLEHFDLSMPMFVKLAAFRAGIIPVRYRRVHCIREGGLKFELRGNPYWLLVLVYNVARVGEVVDVKIKGSNTGWIQMTRNWGQNWQTGENLVGQSLSFQVTVSNFFDDGRTKTFYNVADGNWQFGQSYDGGRNF